MSYELVGMVRDREVRHPLRKSSTKIGRAGTCEIHVAEPAVSREHAEITLDGDRVLVNDLGSRNGTWVNGNRIAGPTAIQHGDRIEIAGLTFELVSARPSTRTILATDATMASSSVAINWKDIYGKTAPGSAAAYKKLDLFQVLVEAGDLLTKQSPLSSLFEQTMDLVDKTVAAERICLLLGEEGTSEPEVRASRLKKPGASGQIMLSKTMLEKVMAERTSYLVADAAEDPGLRDHQSIILSGTRSAMAAPLFDNENVIGVLYADTTDPITRYTRDELRTFSILANLVGMKISQARLAEAEQEKNRLELQLQTAKEILTQILPDKLEDVAGYELSAYLEPCLTVGGDLYDAKRLKDGRIAVLMGDVSGKGLGAALLVSTILGCTNLLTDEHSDPVMLVNRLNRQVWRSTDPIHYAGLFLGVLEPDTGRMTYVNAGHNPSPLLIHPDCTADEIGSTGFPVGMFEDVDYESGELVIEPGGFLALFSDGIHEAENATGDDYGMERLQELLCRERTRGATEIVDRLRDDVTAFLAGEPPNDDVTILLVKREE